MKQPKALHHLRSLSRHSAALLTASLSLSGMAEELPVEKLTLKDVIAKTLANNNDIQVKSVGRLVEEERVNVAKVPFDPTLEMSYNYQWVNTPQNTQDFISTGGGVGSATNPADPILTTPRIFEQRNHVAKAAITNRLPTGTGIEIGSTLRVLDNTLNRQMPPSIYNPEFESFTGITLTQPLLRDFGMRANLAEIRIAKSNAKLADLEWQAQTADTVAEVMKRYYDLVFTTQNVAVQQEAIGLAEKLLDDTQKRSKEGVAAGNDVLVAQAGVSQRTEDLLAAQVQHIERQNALQILFRRAEEVIAVGHRIEPTDSLTQKVPETDRGTLMTLAQGNRYEIKQADTGVEIHQAKTQLARNQSLPRFDLVGSAGYHGLTGEFGSTYERAFDRQGPEWSAGAQFSMPLNWGHLRAGARAAEHEQTQSVVVREKVRLQVALEVDTVLARIRADEKRVAASSVSVEAAKASVDGELKRLKEGVSTSYQVLQLQREYAQTRSRQLAALTDLNKDLVDLYLATGTLLQKQDILVDSQTGVAAPAYSVPAPAPEPEKKTWVQRVFTKAPKKTAPVEPAPPVEDKVKNNTSLWKRFTIRSGDQQQQ